MFCVFYYSGQIEVKGKKVTFDGATAQDQTADIKNSTVNGSPMIDEWHKQSKEAMKSRMVILAIAKKEGMMLSRSGGKS